MTNSPLPRSPITDSTNVETWDSIDGSEIIKSYQDRVGLDVSRLIPADSHVKICRCLDSGYRFYFPFTTVGDETFYRSLTTLFAHSPSIRWEHRKALNLIDPGGKVLEIGCGPGIFLNELKKLGADSVGVELNSEIADKAKAAGHSVENRPLEIHAEENRNTYDVICAFQVLEHIYDISSFFSSLHLALKPGGQLILAVPNNNPYLFKHDRLHALNLPPHHMGLWDKSSLESVPRFFPYKLKTIAIEPCTQARKHFGVLLDHKDLRSLGKRVESAHPAIDSIAQKTIGRFIEGRNIFVSFIKV